MRAVRRLGRTLYLLSALLILGAVWTAKAEPLAHSAPGYPKTDITPVLEQKVFTQSDYTLLYRQTGLGQAAVDSLCERGEARRLLFFQRQFFAPAQWDCMPGSPVTSQEVLRQAAEFGPLEEGDILLTPCSHCGGWRNGHAALVLDAEKGLTLEAVVLGKNSEVRSLESWKSRPAFIVLRLKDTPAEKRREIALAARDQLCGLPYDLLAGIFDGGQKTAGGTQCAHLVWQAFMAFGYDLDSDGGLVVTPSDLAHSPLLEVVQIYGIEAGKRWPTDAGP
ncbi:MAG: hypothetical protein Q4G07_00935 [Oscillospiraceae bacterium]|nr:hypothetical protein [Oscillospiraceae bacterium]